MFTELKEKATEMGISENKAGQNSIGKKTVDPKSEEKRRLAAQNNC